MTENARLRSFVESIMSVRVVRMGGSAAGILGVAGSDDKIVYTLKKRVMAFAHEYDAPKPDTQKIQDFATEIEGYIKSLQLTSTVSMELGDKLMNELDELTRLRVDN